MARILVGIGGGIAAYKVCAVISTLVQAGHDVRAMVTTAAQEFITPLTLTTLCRHPVYDDRGLWQPVHTRPLHIGLAEWADVMVLAPLTANTLAKLAQGLADNLLTNTVLASDCPILGAPAMNTTMWQQPSVQRNWQQLQVDDRYHMVGPTAGLLACDTEGVGRMAEPAAIVDYVISLCHSRGKRDLDQQRVLISAGGTREYLDPVRFIGNPASGKMGVALAQAAAHRGAEVQLVHGPLAVPLRAGLEVESIEVNSAEQMQVALLEAFPEANWMLMAAAVADVKPAEYHMVKVPKVDLPMVLPLVTVPDIVAQLGQMKQAHQQLIGFAAQTGDIVTPALEKLRRKRLDAIVANSIDVVGQGFGCDRNQAIWIDHTGRQIDIPLCSKLAMAHRILDLMQDL